jgi:hypothetical protein
VLALQGRQQRQAGQLAGELAGGVQEDAFVVLAKVGAALIPGEVGRRNNGPIVSWVSEQVGPPSGLLVGQGMMMMIKPPSSHRVL